MKIIIFLCLCILINQVPYAQSIKNSTPENLSRLVLEIARSKDASSIINYSVFEKSKAEKYFSHILTDPFYGGKKSIEDYEKAIERVPIFQKSFAGHFESFLQNGRVMGLDWNNIELISVTNLEGKSLNLSMKNVPFYRDVDIYVNVKDKNTKKIYRFFLDDVNNTTDGFLLKGGFFWDQ